MSTSNESDPQQPLGEVAHFFAVLLLCWLPFVLSCITCIGFAIELFSDPRQDMMALLNAGFLIVATLAVLAFTYAQVAGDKKRPDLIKAGIYQTRATVLVLVSLLVRYGLLHSTFDFILLHLFQTPAGRSTALGVIAGIDVGLLIAAIVLSHVGGWTMLGVVFARQQSD